MSNEQERLNADKVSARDKILAGIQVALEGKSSGNGVPVGDVEMINRHVSRSADKRKS